MHGLLSCLCRNAVQPHSDIQDQNSGIRVSVQGQTTAGAEMPTLRQFLRCPGSAPGAILRSVRRVHGHDHTSGAFSLLREDSAEHRPCGIRNALIQTGLLACAVGQILSCLFVLFGFWTPGHVLDLECFHGDQPEAVDDPSSGLVNKVMASITDALMNTRDSFLSLATFPATLLLLLELALGLRQCLLLLAQEARVLDELTVREGRELFDANIYADLLLGFGERFCLDFTAEAGEPFAGLNANRAGFDLALRRTVNNGLDGSDFGKGDCRFLQAKA